MKIPNVHNIPSYWDEGNRNLVKWYKKNGWKRILRKKWIKDNLKEVIPFYP